MAPVNVITEVQESSQGKKRSPKKKKIMWKTRRPAVMQAEYFKGFAKAMYLSDTKLQKFVREA